MRWEVGELIVDASQPEEVMPVLDRLRAEGVVVEGFIRKATSLEELFMETVGSDGPGAVRKGVQSQAAGAQAPPVIPQ